MRYRQAWVAAAMACCTSVHALTPPDASYDRRNTQIGTYLQYGIPAFGLGLTYLLTPRGGDSGAFASGFFDNGDDDHGWLDWNRMNGKPVHDFWLAFGRMEVLTYALKYTVPEHRPNGGKHSFPSGHTSASFMGAEFIRKEYGWWWGAPAFAAASYVGWTRQQSRNHYTRDVIAGAALGILCNHDFYEFIPRHHLEFGLSLMNPQSTKSPFTVIDDLGGIDNGDQRDTATLVPALSVQLDFGGS